MTKEQPRTGRKQTEETKEKIRQKKLGSKLSEEHRKAISVGGTGRVVSEETKKKLSMCRKGKHHTEEAKEKLRQYALSDEATAKRNKMISERFATVGSLLPKHTHYTSTKTGRIETMDSSWERKYSELLDSDDNVELWTKKHGISIPYEHEGKQRLYYPDFWVRLKSGDVVIVELKGRVDATCASKMCALQQYAQKLQYKSLWIDGLLLKQLSNSNKAIDTLGT